MPGGWFYLESVEIPSWQVADMISFLSREGGLTLADFLASPVEFLMHMINSALDRLKRERDAVEDARRRGGG